MKTNKRMLKAFGALLFALTLLAAVSLCASATDPIPENIGIIYEDAASGLQVSAGRLMPEPLEGQSGAHGGHEMKVLHTDGYGSYAVYIDHAEQIDGVHITDYSNYEGSYYLDCYVVCKIEGDTVTPIYYDRYPHSNGSCAPNIIGGENGKMYVTVISVDNEKYHLTRAEGAFLDVIEFDLTGDQITNTKHSARPDFEIMGVHGYGYSQPIMDERNGKLYALYTGGDVPGYLAWFVYDLATGTWDDTCYTVETESRLAYFNAYADGNGGFYFIGERDALSEALSESLGVKFMAGGYLWDALYLINVPDYTKEEYEIQPIWESPYIKYNDVTKFTNRSGNAAHYDCGGSIVDRDGNLHVLYSTTFGLTSNGTPVLRYTVFDPDHNMISDRDIAFDDPSNDYHLALCQDADGDLYILAIFDSGKGTTAQLEIWRSKDLGATYSKVAKVALADQDGNPLCPGNMIVPTCRNKSYTCDDIEVLIHQDVSGIPNIYSTFSIRLKTPCDHQYGAGASVAPTCTTTGYTKYVCSACGFELHEDIVPALGHNWGAWTVTKAATATKTGTEKRTCPVCNLSETRTVPKLGTSASELLAAAMASFDASYTCSTHGALHAKFIDNPSLNVLNITALFETAFGIEIGSADFTLTVDQSGVDALAASFASVANGSTATGNVHVVIVKNEDGSTVLDKTYILCAEKATKNATVAFQICPEELEIIKGQQAAAFAAFEAQYVCAAHGQAHISYYSSSLLNTTLGTILQKAFDAEKYTVSVNKSDITTALNNAYKALVSGESMELPSVRVTLAHPLFTTCSTTYTLGIRITKDTAAKLNSLIDCPDKPVGIPGDVNGDGELNNADAIYLLRSVMLGETSYPLFYDGDVNSDGAVNNSDAIYLLRYILLGGDYYPIYA